MRNIGREEATPIPFGLARDRKRSTHDRTQPGKRLNSSRTFFEIVDQEAVESRMLGLALPKREE